MKRTKLICLILACLYACTILSACNASDPATPPSTAAPPAATSTPGGTTSTPAPAVVEQEAYSFVYYRNYEWVNVSFIWGDDMISSILEDKFNISVTLAKPDIDPDQKMGIMIASGDLPDVMQVERDAIYRQLINLDMLIPLDGFIDNGSHYSQIVEQGTRDLARVDGVTYGLLNFPVTSDHAVSNNGFAINKKIWEQLGSPKLDTTDDLFDYLMAVKAANITVDGQSVIPLQFFPGDWMVNLMTNSFGVNSLEGVVPIDGHLSLYLNDPRTVDAFVFMNKLWNNGLVNSDYFIEKSEQVMEKLTTGRVAVYGGNNITIPAFNEARLTMIENDPGNDYLVIPPPAAAGVGHVYNNIGSTMGWNSVVVTNTAEKPDRIFELIDYIFSDEGTLLSVYGPQGELYDELDNEGFPILTMGLGSVSAELRAQLGLNQWTLLGNTMFMDMAKLADNARRPVDERDWITESQIRVTYRHAKNDDAVLVGMATNPQEPEGIAFAAFRQLNEQHTPRIIMARTEAECLAAIQEAINDMYSQGFALVEAHKDAAFQNNLRLLGR